MEDIYKKGFLLPEDLEKVEEGKGRKYYIKDIGAVDSVTTVLDKGWPKAYSLIQWFINNTKADIEKKRAVSTGHGTKCHTAFENLAKNHFNIFKLNPDEQKLLEGLKPWLMMYRPVYINSEAPICYISNTVKTAGRIDLLCKINDEDWIVDFKTGKSCYASYTAQVALYAKALDVKRAGILLLKEGGKYEWKEINIEKGFKGFKAAYYLANFEKEEE